MKRLIFIIVLALIATNVNAQLEAGLKAGLNTSKISTDRSYYTPQTVNNYQFGAFARASFGPLYLQPEAYYNSKGGEYIDKLSPSTVNSFDLKTVDVPILLGLKIIKQEAFNVRILAGPVLSILTSKDAKGRFERDNLENSFFGWQYGAGVDFLFMTLDIRKEMYGKNFTPDFDTKSGAFVISLGIKLF
jgi:hypothetical protein